MLLVSVLYSCIGDVSDDRVILNGGVDGWSRVLWFIFFIVISCVLRFCECVLGVNVLLLCSVVVAVKGLVLFM